MPLASGRVLPGSKWGKNAGSAQGPAKRCKAMLKTILQQRSPDIEFREWLQQMKVADGKCLVDGKTKAQGQEPYLDA